MSGYLHKLDYYDEDGCYNVSAVPSSSVNESWFVVLKYFPTCSLSSLVDDVKEAGYRLVIVSDIAGEAGNSVGLPAEVRKKRFPIVIIAKDYTEYLIDNALSDFSNPQIIATVDADADLFIIVMVMISVLVAVPLFMVFCALCCYWRALRLRSYRELTDIQRRRRHNFDRLTDHDHIARRELIDSILRQLQQLQLEGDVQRPLGEDATKKLPTRKYEAASTPEACAICVEEFKSNDQLRVLPCKHFFHIKCIDEWLTNHSDMCPLCKARVLQEEKSEDRRTGRRGFPATMASFDETEETDSEPLISVDGGQRYGRPYGSV